MVDPRPIKEKAFQNEAIRRLIVYVSANGESPAPAAGAGKRPPLSLARSNR
jgi:hypothetical protein